MRNIKIIESGAPRGTEPEVVRLLVEFVPEDADHWGKLECMRGTTWEEGIQEVSSESLSHALHGMLKPLLSSLGRPPHFSAKRVSDDQGVCDLQGNCIKYEEGFCRPGSEKGNGWRKKVGPPGCYQPPVSEVEFQEVFFKVAMAWKEGRHVVVVKGEGFNLL
jgi:hypothetical protein